MKSMQTRGSDGAVGVVLEVQMKFLSVAFVLVHWLRWASSVDYCPVEWKSGGCQTLLALLVVVVVVVAAAAAAAAAPPPPPLVAPIVVAAPVPLVVVLAAAVAAFAAKYQSRCAFGFYSVSNNFW